MRKLLVRPSGAQSIPLLSAGVGLVLGFTGWTTAVAPDGSSQLASSSELALQKVPPEGDSEAQATPAAQSSLGVAVPDELHGAQPSFNSQRVGEPAAVHPVADAPKQPVGTHAPQVQVRIGDHRDFERVVFEWPEPVEHTVVHRGDQVVIGFFRPAMIALNDG